MKIAIVGNGVVGKGMSRLFARQNPYIYDIDGTGTKEGVNACDLAIICVPTPMSDNGSADISAVEECISWIESPLILIKSTVPPGTTEKLSRETGKSICFSPEYMGESSYFTPFWKYPDPERAETHTFITIGGADASKVANYFMKVMSPDTKYALCTSTEAELAKYAENVFFATKVTFCNEFAKIADTFNVEWAKLRELWLLDSRINPNHTIVFEDKRGWSGKCFPKDLRAIISASEKRGYEPKLLKSVWNCNLESVLSFGKEKHGNPEWASEQNYFHETSHPHTED